MPRHALLALALLGTPLHAQSLDTQTEAPRFAASDPIESDTGYTLISWDSNKPVTLELTRSDAPNPPRTLYSGANTSYFVSGLPDGAYTLTLRDEAGVVSAPLALNVAHQSLHRAQLLIALGLVVFLMTVTVIFRGARDD